MLDIELGTPRPVVPGPAAGPGLTVLRANNNLDVIDVDGRRYLAWRTAPVHFASPRTYLHVVASDDGGITWQHETTVDLGRDVREPRFFAWQDRLLLYFFTLGTKWYKFEPGRVHMIERSATGWSAPEPVSDPGVVVWHVRMLDGVPVMSVYKGADTTYTANPEPTRVELWTTDDGRTWRPLDAENPVAHVGGTETDIVEAPGGGWVAVTRKEGPAGWGSDVGRTDGSTPRTWRWREHPIKLDSPLLFRHEDAVLLIARRQVAFGGRYDLGWRRLAPPRRTKAYQFLYWTTRKRTALWQIDPDSLDVKWLIDLPSQGDTCFPGIIDEGGGRYTIYNYTSPVGGFDRPWVLGQVGPTHIHALELRIGGTRSVEIRLVVLAAGLGTRFGGLKQLAPVGPDGETILDYLLARATATGFGGAVLVVSAASEPHIADHLAVRPPALPVTYAIQPPVAGRTSPPGTAHALLAARDALGGASFAVANADDLYPTSAFTILAGHLRDGSREEHALLAFEVGKTLVGRQPVKRALIGIRDGYLASIAEGRVIVGDDGLQFETERLDTELATQALADDAWVSMNLWGLRPAIFDVLEPEVAAFVAARRDGEILLPHVIAEAVAAGARVKALLCHDRCIGVTHPEDAAIVRATLA